MYEVWWWADHKTLCRDRLAEAIKVQTFVRRLQRQGCVVEVVYELLQESHRSLRRPAEFVMTKQVRRCGKASRGDRLKLRPKEELYIACEDLDLSFFKREVMETIRMWHEGWHIADIAATLKRDPDEVAILLIDLARQERIGPRRGGVFGWEANCDRRD